MQLRIITDAEVQRLAKGGKRHDLAKLPYAYAVAFFSMPGSFSARVVATSAPVDTLATREEVCDFLKLHGLMPSMVALLSVEQVND